MSRQSHRPRHADEPADFNQPSVFILRGRFDDDIGPAAADIFVGNVCRDEDALAGDRRVEELRVVSGIRHPHDLRVLAIEQIGGMACCHRWVGSMRITNYPPIVRDHLLGHDVVHRTEVIADRDGVPDFPFFDIDVRFHEI